MQTAVIPADASATARCERRAAEVASSGFALIPSTDFGDLAADPQCKTFHGYWDDLPTDEAMPEGATYRRRRYGRLSVEVSGGGIHIAPLEHAPFRQAAEHIPLHRGRQRVFAPIAPEVLLDPALHSLIAYDVAVVAAVSGIGSWTVNLHMVRIVAQSDVPGEPTPEGRHRDGHLYVAMHLFARTCSGGESIIYHDDAEVARTMLTDPLDSVIVDDNRVTHEVTPIAAQVGDGIRDMLLVDLNAA